MKTNCSREKVIKANIEKIQTNFENHSVLLKLIHKMANHLSEQTRDDIKLTASNYLYYGYPELTLTTNCSLSVYPLINWHDILPLQKMIVTADFDCICGSIFGTQKNDQHDTSKIGLAFLSLLLKHSCVPNWNLEMQSMQDIQVHWNINIASSKWDYCHFSPT